MSTATHRITRRQRRALRSLIPLVALVTAAAMVWQASNAAFSASSSNTSNAWATGSLLLTNNGGGATYAGTTTALFNESNLKPGDAGVKCITVESGGTLAGSLKLYRGAISGTNGAALAAVLDLTVDAVGVGAGTNVAANCTGYSGGTSGAVYSGNLNAMPASYTPAAGTAVAAGTQRIAYRIAWALDSNAGNAVQGSTAQTDLTWEIN